MSTTTEATEGQAKIQDALRDGMYYAQRAMDHDSSLGKMKSADEAEAAFDRMAAARIIAQGIAQAPQSSPAPGAQPDGIMNEGYLEATRAHGSPAPSVIEAIELMEAYEQAGGDGWWKAWDKVKAAAKASRPSVTAAKHLNLEDEARVWYREYESDLDNDNGLIVTLAAFASHVLSLSPAAQGVTVDQIKGVISEVDDMHPYKVAGNADSYSSYNEGWSDACGIIEGRLSALLTK
jgi:hypothetical protein